jgi:hypothetical protein
LLNMAVFLAPVHDPRCGYNSRIQIHGHTKDHFHTLIVCLTPPPVYKLISSSPISYRRTHTTHTTHGNSALSLDSESNYADLGRPPNSHSAQMYGPGLKMTKRSSSMHISMKRGRSRKRDMSRPPVPKSKTPLSGSCRFHGTYLEQTFVDISRNSDSTLDSSRKTQTCTISCTIPRLILCPWWHVIKIEIAFSGKICNSVWVHGHH